MPYVFQGDRGVVTIGEVILKGRSKAPKFCNVRVVSEGNGKEDRR
jgi:hypothetical protein